MSHIWKAYLTVEIVRQEKCPKYTGFSNLLCQAKYCVPVTCTCSTFPCLHAAVVSCFALNSISI